MCREIDKEAEKAAVEETIELSQGPGENYFWGCAEEGRADFLVTLSPRDFPQKKLQPQAISPREFQTLIRRRGGVL